MLLLVGLTRVTLNHSLGQSLIIWGFCFLFFQIATKRCSGVMHPIAARTLVPQMGSVTPPISTMGIYVMISDNVGQVFTSNRALPNYIDLPVYSSFCPHHPTSKAVSSILPPIPHLLLVHDPNIWLPDQIQNTQINFI